MLRSLRAAGAGARASSARETRAGRAALAIFDVEQSWVVFAIPAQTRDETGQIEKRAA